MLALADLTPSSVQEAYTMTCCPVSKKTAYHGAQGICGTTLLAQAKEGLASLLPPQETSVSLAHPQASASEPMHPPTGCAFQDPLHRRSCASNLMSRFSQKPQHSAMRVLAMQTASTHDMMLCVGTH